MRFGVWVGKVRSGGSGRASPAACTHLETVYERNLNAETFRLIVSFYIAILVSKSDRNSLVSVSPDCLCTGEANHVFTH